MSGWTALAAIVIFFAAIVLACLATVATFRCLGRVVGRDCRKRFRLAYAAGAAASFMAIFAAIGAGFVGISRIL